MAGCAPVARPPDLLAEGAAGCGGPDGIRRPQTMRWHYPHYRVQITPRKAVIRWPVLRTRMCHDNSTRNPPRTRNPQRTRRPSAPTSVPPWPSIGPSATDRPGLNDEQAGLRTTASELCLGGIIKHVTLVEQGWVQFISQGPAALGSAGEGAAEAHAAGFRMLDGDSLASLLEGYENVARRTDELVASLDSLDTSQPLPEAPWFEPGAKLVGPTGASTHHRRNGPARRPRRHHSGVDRRRQNDGVTGSDPTRPPDGRQARGVRPPGRQS